MTDTPSTIRHLLWTALVGLALIAAACGGETASEGLDPAPNPAESLGPQTPAEDPDDQLQFSGTVEDWANQVVAVRTQEAQDLQANLVANTIDTTPESFADDLIKLCTGDVEIRAATALALPEAYGDPVLDEPYLAWLEARSAADAAGAELCDLTIAERQTIAEAALGPDGPLGWTPEPGSALALAADAQIELGERELAGCFPVQETLGPLAGDVLPCDNNVDCPDCPSGPSEEAVPSDAAFCGDDAGSRGQQVVLAAGPCGLAWFPVPFALETQTDLIATADAESLWLETADGNFFVEIHAPAAVADPDALGAYDVVGEVPIPMSLGDWFAAMPVEVLDEQVLDMAGSTATRWLVAADREASIAATGEESVALWDGGRFDVVLAAFEGGETRYIWEVRRPDGALVTIHGLYMDPFGFTFDGLAEWVESEVLGGFAFS